MKPKVLIEVKSGVATYRTDGDVEVCVVDYDVIDLGEDPPQIPEEFFELFEGLKESLHAK